MPPYVIRNGLCPSCPCGVCLRSQRLTWFISKKVCFVSFARRASLVSFGRIMTMPFPSSPPHSPRRCIASYSTAVQMLLPNGARSLAFSGLLPRIPHSMSSAKSYYSLLIAKPRAKCKYPTRGVRGVHSMEGVGAVRPMECCGRRGRQTLYPHYFSFKPLFFFFFAMLEQNNDQVGICYARHLLQLMQPSQFLRLLQFRCSRFYASKCHA